MRSFLKRGWLFPENVPLVLRPLGFDNTEDELRLNLCHSDNSRDKQGFMTASLGLNVFYDPTNWRYHPTCTDALPKEMLAFYNRYKRFEKPPFECADLFDHLYVESGFGAGLSLSTIESYRWPWIYIVNLGSAYTNEKALAGHKAWLYPARSKQMVWRHWRRNPLYTLLCIVPERLR